MALHFDLTKIEDHESLYEEVTEEKMALAVDETAPPSERGGRLMKEVGTGVFETGWRMKALAFVMIHATIWTGMPGITQENAWEFFERLDMMQQNGDAFLIGTNEEGQRVTIPLTYEHVLRHVGLHTNAAPMDRLTFVERQIEKRRS